ncbi:MAG: DUF4190 domain-containing protein [Planctomycetota bacterium]|jgi:hypothetical protein
MGDVSNISSEEELLELRNEGKISEDEYEELLETLRKSAKTDEGSVAQVQVGPTRTCGLAVASLVFALTLGPFGLIPAAVCGHLALRKIGRDASLRGRGLALAGLIAGYSIFGLTAILTVWTAGLVLDERVAAISPPEAIELTQLRQFALDDTDGLLTQSGVGIDRQISSDGNGSLRIDATESTTVRLFETGDLDIESASVIYQAKVRTENVEGQVYLEMLCHFPGKGEFFSKGLTSPLTGTTDWTAVETPFLLAEGENPDNVKLNLVINGKGTVWIDDIRLLKGRSSIRGEILHSSPVVPE